MSWGRGCARALGPGQLCTRWGQCWSLSLPRRPRSTKPARPPRARPRQGAGGSSGRAPRVAEHPAAGRGGREAHGHSPWAQGSAPHSRRGTVGDARRPLVGQRRASRTAEGLHGLTLRRFLLFLSPHRRLLGGGGRERKKKSWAAVAGKCRLSHLPAPLSLPSQVLAKSGRGSGGSQGQLHKLSAHARAAGCRGWVLVGVSCLPHRTGALGGLLTSPTHDRERAQFGKLRRSLLSKPPLKWWWCWRNGGWVITVEKQAFII